MAKTARLLGLLLCAPVTALVLSAAGCTSLPTPPSMPAYDTDVRPIFLSHCTRCHGNGPDGGALNVPTEPTSHDAAPVFTDTEVASFFGSSIFLTQFQSTNCATDSGIAPPDCREGAKVYGPLIPKYVDSSDSTLFHMPPPPAPDLNEFERGVLDAWATNPICTRSANPDPVICPPGS